MCKHRLSSLSRSAGLAIFFLLIVIAAPSVLADSGAAFLSQPDRATRPIAAPQLAGPAISMDLSGAPAQTNAGASLALTVTLRDSLGDVATGYTGTVAFASSDLQATLPATYTFTTGDNGDHLFSGIILRVVGSRTITVTAVNSPALSSSVSVNVDAGTVSAALSKISVTSPHLADGVDAAMIVITTTDAFSNPATGQSVWVVATGISNTFTALPGATNASGIFSTTLTSAQAQAKELRALVGSGTAYTWLAARPIVEFTRSSITGTVFSDANRDNVPQANEPGLGAVQVTLYPTSGATPLKSTVTDGTGHYQFAGLEAGTYRVAQTPLDQFAFSASGVITITLGDFATSANHHFGNYAAATVAGEVWSDNNQDGARQTDEPSLPGVTISAYDGNALLTASAATNPSGTYRIDLAAPLPAAPDNFIFNSGGLLMQEPASAYIANGDFARGLTPLAASTYPANHQFTSGLTALDPATYPANYNFSSGNLGGWTPSDAGQVQVITDALSLAGPYLRINAPAQWADSPAFNVPNEAQSLRFNYFNWGSGDGNTSNGILVYVLSGATFTTSTYLGEAWGTFNQGWQAAVMDLQAYRGQAIKLHFVTYSGYQRADKSRVDNLSLNIETPAWAVSTASAVQVTDDAYSLDGGYLQLNGAAQWANSPSLVVPAEAQTLRFNYFNWGSGDANTTNGLFVYALTGPTFATSTYVGEVWSTFSQGWQSAVMDLQAYQGQTIKLRFVTYSGFQRADKSRIDNLSLNIEAPDWNVSSASVVQVANDIYSLDGGYLQLNGAAQWANSPALVVPAAAQTLRFNYFNWGSGDANTTNGLYVYALSGPTFETSTYTGEVWSTFNQGWQTAVMDVQAYRGQTIKLRFVTYSGYQRVDKSRIDNLVLRIETPGWTLSNAGLGSIGAATLPNANITTLSNADFSQGAAALPSATYPANSDFSTTLTLLDSSTYPANADFADGLTLLDSSTYPANYDFATGDLGAWLPSNASLVQVVNDIYAVTGPYLSIGGPAQSADSPAFNVPTEVQSVRFNYFNWGTTDMNTTNGLFVYVLTGPTHETSNYLGEVWSTFKQGWQTAVLDLQAYRGQNIQLRFVTYSGYQRADKARIDNVVLAIETPAWAPLNAQVDQVISDTFNLAGAYLRLNGPAQWANSAAFVVPADTQTLRFNYFNWGSGDMNTTNGLFVYALTGPNFDASTYLGEVWSSFNQGWQTAIMDLQAFRGQSIKLHFVTNSGYQRADKSRIDKVALAIETPDWSTSDARLDRVISDTFNLDDAYLQLNGPAQWANSSAFVVPADAQTLRFNFFNWGSGDGNVTNGLFVYALSGPAYGSTNYLGEVWSTFNQGWQSAEMDLQAYRGQSIKLRFVTNSGYQRADKARIDNVAFHVETPDWNLSVATLGNITATLPPASAGITAPFNADFSQSAITLPVATFPWNYDFSVDLTPLPTTTYPTNSDLAIGLTALDPATYPANYNFSIGSLGAWTPSNAGIVQVVSDTFNVDGPYLLLNAPNSWANSPAFVVPDDAQTLRFNYFNWGTGDPTGSNGLFVYALTGASFEVTTYIGEVWSSLNQGWQTAVLDLQAYRGQNIQLRFVTYSGYQRADKTRIDNLSLDIETPAWTPSNGNLVQVISDTANLDGAHLRLNGPSQWADTSAFVVPADAQALRFNYFNWGSGDPTTTNGLFVYALTGPSFEISTYLGEVWSSLNQGWQTAVMDVQAYRGQSIKLHFVTYSGYQRADKSRVDNLSLNLEAPYWQPSNAAVVQVIRDEANLDGPYLRLNGPAQSVESPAFEVPAAAQTLQFNYFNWGSGDPTTTNGLFVYALTGPAFESSSSLGEVWSNLSQGWQTATMDVQAYQGRRIKLRFVTNSGYQRADKSRIDNVILKTATPGWKLSDAKLGSIQSSGGVTGAYLALTQYNVSADSIPFLVPTNTDSLRFDYTNATYRDPATARPLYVYAYSGDNFSVVTSLGTLSGSQNDGWKQANLNLTMLRGRVIKLRFLTDTDSYWNGTSKIDNVQLLTGATSAPAGNYPNPDGAYLWLNRYDVSAYSAPFTVLSTTESVRFDYQNWAARDSNASRPLYVYALSGPNFEFSTALGTASGSATEGWKQITLTLPSQLHGQVIKLQFRTDTDSYWNGQSKIDHITLINGTATGGTNSSNPDGPYLALNRYDVSADSNPFLVPTGTQSLRFDFLNSTYRGSTSSRPLYVVVLPGPAFTSTIALGTVWGAALDGWKQITLTLTAYQSQTIKLRFRTDTDSYWNTTSKIDNVYLLPLSTAPYTITEINPPNYTSTTPDSVPLTTFGGANFTLNFGDYGVDRYNSSVEVAPLRPIADGVEAAIVTVTVRSGSNAPMPDQWVQVQAPGAAITITQPLAPTDAQGQAIAAIRSTRAQNVIVSARTISDNVTLAQAVPITFTAGAASAIRSAFAAQPDTVSANSIHTAIITVTLRDAFDNPAIGRAVTVTHNGTAIALNLPNTTTNAQGVVTGTLSSTQAQTVTMSALDLTDAITVAQQATVRFTTVDPQQSALVIAPNNVFANGVATAIVTVTLRDSAGVPLPNKPAQLFGDNTVYINGQAAGSPVSIGSSGPNGTATAIVTSTIVGVKAIHATGDNVPLNTIAPVTFTVGTVDVALSQLQTDRASLVADGVSYATLSAVIVDGSGHAVPDQTVLIRSTGQVTVTQPNTISDAQGRVQAALKSATVQNVIVSAFVQTANVTLTHTAHIAFLPGPADVGHSFVVMTPITLTANGTHWATITATLRDALDHPLNQRAIQFVTTGSGNTLQPASVQNANASGQAVFQMASTVAEVKQIAVRDVTYNVSVPGGTLTYVPGVLSPTLSSLSASPATGAADGVSPVSIIVTLRDQYNNPIPGYTVALTATGGSVAGNGALTLTQPSSTTNNNGQAQGTLLSGVSQVITVTAFANGVTLPPVAVNATV